MSDDYRTNPEYLAAVACSIARDQLVIAMADCVIDCARTLDANFRQGGELPSIKRLADAMADFQRYIPK